MTSEEWPEPKSSMAILIPASTSRRSSALTPMRSWMVSSVTSTSKRSGRMAKRSMVASRMSTGLPVRNSPGEMLMATVELASPAWVSARKRRQASVATNLGEAVAHVGGAHRGQDLRRTDGAELGVGPADQRLMADDGAGPEVVLALEDHVKAAVREGVADLGLDALAALELDAQLGVEAGDAALALLLGGVERDVGGGEQPGQLRRVLREQGEADRGAHRRGDAVDQEGALHIRHHPFAQDFGPFPVVAGADDDGELVAAEAGR